MNFLKLFVEIFVQGEDFRKSLRGEIERRECSMKVDVRSCTSIPTRELLEVKYEYSNFDETFIGELSIP